jgi:hypothetical protein
MGKYGGVAKRAVALCNEGPGSPITAWKTASCELLGKGTSSQKKGCPREAFLGVCEKGIVKGIPPGVYTQSVKNKEYAMRALEVLEKTPNVKTSDLWRKVAGERSHNGQMDVVLSLWELGLIDR